MTALHVLEELVCAWLLAAVMYGIGWAIVGLIDDLRAGIAAGQHVRATPEPTRLTLVAGERPRLFDQDAVA